MKRTQFTFSILFIDIMSLLAFAQTVTRPNVLLVLSDDHSAAHVGAYGNADIKTPNLDAFAKEGCFSSELTSRRRSVCRRARR
jgi:Sulfatase